MVHMHISKKMCILLVWALWLQGGNCGRTQYWKEFLKCNHLVISGFKGWEIFLFYIIFYKILVQRRFQISQSCFCETNGQEIKPLSYQHMLLIASIVIMDPLVYLSCLIPWKRCNLHIFCPLFAGIVEEISPDEGSIQVF